MIFVHKWVKDVCGPFYVSISHIYQPDLYSMRTPRILHVEFALELYQYICGLINLTLLVHLMKNVLLVWMASPFELKTYPSYTDPSSVGWVTTPIGCHRLAIVIPTMSMHSRTPV